jgi:cell division protein FtsL
MPRIEQEQLTQQVIRNCRTQTVWSRWALRVATAAALVGLLLVTYSQRQDLLSLRKEVHDLRAKVSTLENKIELQQAGM